MYISKIYKSINVIGIFILMAITSSCSDNVVGVEGFCPLVESTTPVNLEADVRGNSVVTVTFEEKINPATMVPAAFTLTSVVTDSSTGSPVKQTIEMNGSMTFNNDTNTMSFTPNAPLDYNTVYTGTVKKSIEDPLGNKMLEDYVWSFTIEAPSTFTLNVTSDNGSVTKNPDQEGYEDGSQVVLTATPDDGFVFTSWSGDASGSESSLTVTMDDNKNITANFTAIAAGTFALNVTVVNGSVTKDPNQQSYNDGSQVVLTATPADGYEFTSWSGDATGSDNPLTVTMDANKDITANFTAVEPAIIVDLGDAARFGSFGGNAGVTNQGINTVVNGSIGTTAASTLITGFHDELTGDVYTETTQNIGAVTNGIFTAPPAPGTATSQQIAEDALLDATAARNSISPASKPGGIDLGTDELGGLTLEPGIYKSATGEYSISDVDLTLDAQGDENAVWIFQAESSLTVGTPTGPRSIIMTNGASPKNVFWYIGSAATINGAGGGTMVGTILSEAGVTFSTAGNVEQTVLNGRAISLIASVTMVNTTINVPE